MPCDSTTCYRNENKFTFTCDESVGKERKKHLRVWHYLDLKDMQGEAGNRIKREERREWLRHVLFEFHL